MELPSKIRIFPLISDPEAYLEEMFPLKHDEYLRTINIKNPLYVKSDEKFYSCDQISIFFSLKINDKILKPIDT